MNLRICGFVFLKSWPGYISKYVYHFPQSWVELIFVVIGNLKRTFTKYETLKNLNSRTTSMSIPHSRPDTRVQLRNFGFPIEICPIIFQNLSELAQKFFMVSLLFFSNSFVWLHFGTNQIILLTLRPTSKRYFNPKEVLRLWFEHFDEQTFFSCLQFRFYNNQLFLQARSPVCALYQEW